MENRRKLARQRRLEIIDALVAEATSKMFHGDIRDGATPAINFENFLTEMIRHGATAYRARLIHLSHSKLMVELAAAAAHSRIRNELQRESLTLAKRYEREDAERAHRDRQAELGRRHKLQPGILAAACYYREYGLSSKNAWREIERQEYSLDDGSSIVIEDGTMRQSYRAGRRNRLGIKIGQWQKRYWLAARP